MTKFMQQRFSVFANYSEPTCDGCGQERKVYYIYESKRYCADCEEIRRENKKKELLQKLSTLENRPL